MDETALLRACHDAARVTLWQKDNPQATSLDATATLAAQFKALVVDHAPYLEAEGIDANVLTSCVKYLVHVHAIPPMRDNAWWLNDMMEVLVNLISPNTRLDDESVEFLRTLRDAIDFNINAAGEIE